LADKQAREKIALPVAEKLSDSLHWT